VYPSFHFGTTSILCYRNTQIKKIEKRGTERRGKKDGRKRERERGEKKKTKQDWIAFSSPSFSVYLAKSMQ
jgi:hypothetical protein